MIKHVLASGLLFAAQCFAQVADNAAAKPLGSFERDLINHSKAFMAELTARNLNNVKQFTTEDFHRVGSDGRLQDRGEFLEDAAEGNLKKARLYEFVVIAVDDEAGIVTYNAVIEMAEGDDGLAPKYQHFSDVWVKQGDQWRLRFEQSTPRRSID